jgi:hypothetical protein
VGSLYWRYWTDLAAAVAKLAESALKKQVCWIPLSSLVLA